MRKCKRWMRRSLAWLLCLVMTVGMLSTAAVADNTNGNNKTSAENTDHNLKIEVSTDLYDVTWDDTGADPSVTYPKFAGITVKISGGKGHYNSWGWWVGDQYTVVRSWEEQWYDGNPSEEFHYSPIHNKQNQDTNASTKSYTAKNTESYVSFDGLTVSSEEGQILAKRGIDFRCRIDVKDAQGNIVATCYTSTAHVKYSGRVTFDYNYKEEKTGWIPGAFYEWGTYEAEKGEYTHTTFESGKTVSKPENDPTREGYEFTGWYTDKECTQKFDFATKLYDRTTLYAGWAVPTPKVNVTLVYNHDNMGALDGNKDVFTINKGAAFEKPEDPSCQNPGHEFQYWCTDKELQNEYKLFGTPVNDDLVLYARWGYRVKFDLNYHGSGKIDDQLVLKNGTVEKPKDPQDKDYTFLGWKKSGSNSLYDFNSSVTGSFTLVAQWAEKKKVTFKYGHGQEDFVVKVDKGGTIDVTKFEIPTIEGFQFAGWYYKNGAKDVEFTKDTKVNNSMTVTAKWDTVSYNATLDASNAKKDYLKGETIKAADINGVKIIVKKSVTGTVVETKNIDVTVDMLSGFNGNNLGEQTVYVSYNNNIKEFSYKVNVRQELALSASDVVYNGNVQKVAKLNVSGVDAKYYTITYSDGSETVDPYNAGTYTAKLTVTTEGAKRYTIANGKDTCTFMITPIKLTVNWGSVREFTYDNGKELKPTPEFVGLLESDKNNKNAFSYSTVVTKKNSNTPVSSKEVGEYTIKVTGLSGLAAGNYKLPTDTSFDFKIVAATGEIELNVTGEKTVVYGATFPVKVMKNNNNGTVSFNSSDSKVATVAYDAKTKSYVVTAVALGETTITATLTKNGYTEATASFKVTVNPKPIELKWENLEQTYNGNEIKPKVSIITNITGLEACKVILSVEGFESGKYPTNYREGGYKVTAALDNDKYVISGQNYRTLKIKKANSTVKLDQNTIKTVYGNVPFMPGYTVTGGTATLSSKNNNVVTINNDGFIEIVHAGKTEVKVSVKGDNNHNDTSATIKVVIDSKPVHIAWKKTEFDYDGKSHLPVAEVVTGEIVGNDKCIVNVDFVGSCQGTRPKADPHHAQATSIINTIDGSNIIYQDYTFAPDAQTQTKFYVRNVVDYIELDTDKYSEKEYFIGVDEEGISVEDLDLTGLTIVKHFKYEDAEIKAEKIQVTSDMLTFDGTQLGVQNVKVTYKDDKLGTVEVDTFKITIKKQLKVAWSKATLVYSGEAQAPGCVIKGVEDAGDIVTINAPEDAINAILDDDEYYVVTAEINEDMLDKYVFIDGEKNVTEVQNRYKIVRKAVTITDWTADDAANAASWTTTDFLFWYDEKTHCPNPVLEGVLAADGKIFDLTITNAEVAPSNVGYYTAEVDLTNTNYYLKGDNNTASFAILKKIDAAEFTIRVPQCGETVKLYGAAFDKVMGTLMQRPSKPFLVVDGVAELHTSDGLAAVPVFEFPDETDYTWAELVNGIEDVTTGYGFLLPQIVVDEAEFENVDLAYLNAINENMPNLSENEQFTSFTVEGGKVYTVVAVLKVNRDAAAVDREAIAEAIKVASADENAKVTIQHVIAGTNAIVVFADIEAVHNYGEFELTKEPTEDELGEETRYCEANKDHTDKRPVDKLVPASIEVITDGAITDYHVNEELNVKNLKIKVTYTVGSTAEKPVTKDMVTNFDSSKVVTGKAVTVEYKGLTDDYKINVAKKQSSVKLSGDDTVTKVYGDKPFDVEFETENGTAVLTSSDESVAKIVDGQVVIVGAGTAKITAKIAETDEVTGSEDSFDLIVNKKVVGLTWSNLEFTEDGQEHVPSAEATGVLEGDSCTVTVEGATKKAGETIATATKLSNDNYALPENASVKFKINEKKTAEPKDVDPVQKGETEPEKKDEPEKTEPEKTEPEKTEPEKTEPEKTEPEKTEPEKTEPEKKDEVVEVVLIEIGDKVKRNYIVNDKIDLTDVTITTKTANGTEQVTVTEDMVTGFDTSKPADNVEVTITYKGTSKQFNITVADLIYYTIEGNLAPASGENLVLVVHRSVHDELTFSLYLGTYIDGVLVPQTALKTWSGSLNMIMYAEYIKTLSAGKHNIEIRFADGKALAEITVAKVETNKKDDSQTEKNTPKTADTSSMVLWFIILVAAALAFVATRVYANKRRSVE